MILIKANQKSLENCKKTAKYLESKKKGEGQLPTTYPQKRDEYVDKCKYAKQ